MAAGGFALSAITTVGSAFDSVGVPVTSFVSTHQVVFLTGLKVVAVAAIIYAIAKIAKACFQVGCKAVNAINTSLHKECRENVQNLNDELNTTKRLHEQAVKDFAQAEATINLKNIAVENLNKRLTLAQTGADELRADLARANAKAHTSNLKVHGLTGDLEIANAKEKTLTRQIERETQEIALLKTESKLASDRHNITITERNRETLRLNKARKEVEGLAPQILDNTLGGEELVAKIKEIFSQVYN